MSGINLSDYALGGGGSINGNSSASEVAMLQKAMEAGEITGRENQQTGATGGSVLKVESLEHTMTWLTTKEEDIVLWKKIPKSPAYNTVEEYNQLIDYGAEGNSFNNEGELPQEDSTTFARKSALIKYMGNTRVISHPMTLVKVQEEIGNVVTWETKMGTLKILRDIDRKLTSGNSENIFQEFDGFYKQQLDAFSSEIDWYKSEVVIDMKGKALTETAFQTAALNLVENNGYGNLLMAPPEVLSNFVERFQEFKLIQPNTSQLTDGQMGQVVNKFHSQFGVIEMGYDKFLKRYGFGSAKGRRISQGKTNDRAPDSPVAGTIPTAVADSNTEFGAAFAGDYYYAVSAFNRYGESAIVPLNTPNTATTIGADEAVDLTFTDGGGPVGASGYKIYRTQNNPTDTSAASLYYAIKEISVAKLTSGVNGAVAGSVRDLNYTLPGTEDAFLIDSQFENWRFKQLAPLMKMDLPPLGPAIRFMILLYGTPILAAPKKMIRITNIGNDFS